MIDAVIRALGMALAMGWEILWPLILGFALCVSAWKIDPGGGVIGVQL